VQEFFVASGLSRLLKNSRSPFERLRACREFIEGANGAHVEMIEHFPFVLSLSKHSEIFFSRLLIKCRYSLFTDPLISTQERLAYETVH
jgi:hypothetical protein